MATLSINNIAAVGTVSIPRIGAWHADLSMDTDDASQFAGMLSLVIGDGASTITLVGTPKRIGAYTGTVSMRLVAGAAKLATPAKAKYYSLPTLKIPLTDLISDAGETLSSSADAAVLGTQLLAWANTPRPTAFNITSLLASGSVGTSWRMLADGTVWVGPEAWPDASLDYVLLNSWPEENKIEISSEAPVLMPGTVLDGLKISYVEHHITAAVVHSFAWVEA